MPASKFIEKQMQATKPPNGALSYAKVGGFFKHPDQSLEYLVDNMLGLQIIQSLPQHKNYTVC